MMLAIDREVRVGHHVYPKIPLDALIDALAARAMAAPGRKLPSRSTIQYPRKLEADGGTIMPSDIARAINDLFDRHGPMPMTADIGDCLFTAMEIENTALAAPGYYAGMGFGVPAGVGVAATGRRPLILVGDGAFQMTGWELASTRSSCCSTIAAGRCCARSSRSRSSTTSRTGTSPILPNRSAATANASRRAANWRRRWKPRMRGAGSSRLSK
jgi:TPP-dependent 2-oxoacid decarboxylase